MNNSMWNQDSDKGIRDDANPLLNAAYRVATTRAANRNYPVSERPPVPKIAVLLCDALDVADEKLYAAQREISVLQKMLKDITAIINGEARTE